MLYCKNIYIKMSLYLKTFWALPGRMLYMVVDIKNLDFVCMQLRFTNYI